MAGDNKVSRSFVISLMLAMIITGACNTLGLFLVFIFFSHFFHFTPFH